MSAQTFAQRLQYSMRVRWPLAMRRIREWGLTPYVPGSMPLDAGRLLIQESDYVLGEMFNVAGAPRVAVEAGLETMAFELGSSYRLTFEAEKPSKNFTLPGDGFLELPGTNALLRIYKVSFREGNMIDVDVMVARREPKKQSSAPVLEAGVLIPIVVVVGAIAAALLAVYGYLSLKEVRKIVVSPSGFVIAAIALVVLFPTLKRLIVKRGG